jgi:hypothetical protein
MKEKEIDLNAAVRCPKERLRWFKDLKSLIEGKTFPGCTDPRRPDQYMNIRNVNPNIHGSILLVLHDRHAE